ncbi:MAG: hypothetical protein GY862_10610 [Gammaproteobacteria bacterium]|nr:hypothetical protein [Gammaproteobacteria bacterium]
MKLKMIALATGLLPLAAVHIAYLLAAHTGYVSWCIPYLDGCTSISKTGRHGFPGYVFRGTMIPAGVFLMIYWRLAYEWLIAMGDKKGGANGVMCTLGIIAGIFLILYAAFLGSKGDFYQFLRRFGVIIYFSFTFLAQLFMTSRIRYLMKHRKIQLSRHIYNAKLGLGIALLCIGLLSIPMPLLYSGAAKDCVENILEWNFALVMISYFLISYFVWRNTAFEAHFSVGGGSNESVQNKR